MHAIKSYLDIYNFFGGHWYKNNNCIAFLPVHSGPVYLERHLQSYPALRGIHMPLFWQGFGEHFAVPGPPVGFAVGSIIGAAMKIV